MQPNVLLGIPSGGSVKTKTMFSIISVMVQSTCPLTIVERSGALGPDNRNHLAQMALDGGYTHLFLVDADMSFPGDTLDRLLARNKDLIGTARPQNSVFDIGAYEYIVSSGGGGGGMSETPSWSSPRRNPLFRR